MPSASPISILCLFNIVALLVMGVLLLLLKTPPALRRQQYHRAKRCLGVAILFVTASEITLYFHGASPFPNDLFPVSILVAASLQACLFTFLLLILFRSAYATTRNIVKRLSPVLIFIVAYSLSVWIRGDVEVYTPRDYLTYADRPALLLRTGFAAVYGCELVAYVCLFRKEQAIYRRQIDEHHPGASPLTLRWGSLLFYQATSIGVVVLFFCIKPTQIANVLLTLLTPFFYGAIAIRYINFQYNQPVAAGAGEHGQIEPYGLIEAGLPVRTGIPAEDAKNDLCPETRRDLLCVAIREILVDEKEYRDPSFTRDKMIGRLGTNKALFIDAFRHCFGMSFHEYLNLLRLSDGINLLEGSDLSIEDISEKIGYGTVRTFQRQFQYRYGMSPKEYRKRVMRQCQ